ncbi:hypothetical protein V0288_04960 [Pannus brasiliensis CCIBt3594]|uniref:Uncharacterized protein n=1 Tax=Pannus brasiliensis CCIBt3594 TaxID=1427578 RepID=A0AAW9QSZ1_9CHRO
MEKASIIQKVNEIANKREYLTRLRDKPDIGGLRLDIDQALEELEELLDEFHQTFPDERIG